MELGKTKYEKRCIFEMEITLANEFKSCTKQNILFQLFSDFFHLMIEFKINIKHKTNSEALIYKLYYDIVDERKLYTKPSRKSTRKCSSVC